MIRTKSGRVLGIIAVSRVRQPPKNHVSHLALAGRRLDAINDDNESLSVASAESQIVSEGPSNQKFQKSTPKASKLSQVHGHIGNQALAKVDATVTPETLDTIRGICPYSLTGESCPLESDCRLKRLCVVRDGRFPRHDDCANIGIVLGKSSPMPFGRL